MREQFLVEIEQIGEMVAGSKCTLKQSQEINKLLEKLATTITTRIEIANVNPTSQEQLAAPAVSNCKLAIAKKCKHRKLTDKKICTINNSECAYYC